MTTIISHELERDYENEKSIATVSSAHTHSSIRWGEYQLTEYRGASGLELRSVSCFHETIMR